MTLLDNHSSAFLAKHLHTLRKLITKQSDALLEHNEILIPSHSVSIILHLYEHRGTSITDLAEALAYSHQLVNQRLKALHHQGLIRKTADSRDRRRSRIALSEQGAQQAEKLLKLLPQATKAFQDMFNETGIDLSAAVNQIAAALNQKPLTQRIESQTLETNLSITALGLK